MNDLGGVIIGCAINVHSKLGPGLLESAYQKCLAYELRKNDLHVETEVVLPIVYEEVVIDAGYRVDMVINDRVIIENKTVERILPIHEAQLLTYLRLRSLKLGYIFNWNVPTMKDGIKRLVHNF